MHLHIFTGCGDVVYDIASQYHKHSESDSDDE